MVEVRSEIDRLDRTIIGLLAERTEYVRQAGHIKASRGLVRDEERVRDVLNKARGHARAHGIDEELIDALYRLLVERSIAYEFGVFDKRQQVKP